MYNVIAHSLLAPRFLNPPSPLPLRTDAQKTGVAQETVKNATSKVASGMSVQEAQLILGVDQNAPWGDVVKRFKHLFDVRALCVCFAVSVSQLGHRDAFNHEGMPFS